MEGEEDHDYVIRPGRTRRQHFLRSGRRNQIQVLENTDHDYLATAEDLDDADDGDTDGMGAENDQLEQQQDELENAENVPPPPAIEQQYDDETSAAEDDAPETMESANNPHDPGPIDLTEAAGTSNAAATTAESNGIINLTTSPSPPKKRKRLSLGNTPKNATPKMKTSTAGNSDEDDDDSGLICPICLDTWEMSGEHRLVSLRCGHLFGDSCIRRWLAESARQSGIKACPQCKTKANNKDIRCLYAKRLRAIDRSEEHRLRQQLDDECQRSRTLQTELATLKMSYTLVTTKIQSLESDNERMKLILRTGGGGGGFSYDSEISNDPKMHLQTYKLFMERNIEIAREPGCRVIVHSEQQSCMIVSQKSSQNLFPGYGLRFIDTPTFKPLHFLHASAKLLRDISLSADQQMLAVASMETRAKLFDLRSRQVTAMFTPGERAVWACAMDRNERENFLYLGAQHGSTYVYDVRFPETIVDEFKVDGDCSPVINIAPVAAGKYFPSGGFLVCKLQSLWFFEYSSASGTATPFRLNVEGPFISMNFDAAHDTLLISARSSARYPQSRYILGKLEKIADMPIFNIKVSFFGSKISPVMTRCTQIAVESNTLIAGYMQDAKLMALFDVRREQRLQSLPVQELVYDTCPVYLSNATFLAALTETKCRLYKLSTTS